MKDSKRRRPSYTDGIINTLKRSGILMPDQYAWHTYTDDSQLVCLMEADHRQKEVTKINLKEGFIIRNMNPDGHADKSAITQRHARQLFEALQGVYERNETVRILLSVNALYSKTPERQTRSMLLNWNYNVTEFSGDWVEGYHVRFEDDFGQNGNIN